jgi:hypothetical protein
MRAMRPATAQVTVGLVLVALLAATAIVLLAANQNDANPGKGSARVDRFDGPAAFRLLKLQLSYGPRPAGSPASRRLAQKLRRMLPHGHFEPVPHGLRNIVARVPGTDPSRYIVVGAHYDTKEIPHFLGANDGAGGTAAVVQLARQLRPRTIGPSVVFILFDGEEAPGPTDDFFLEKGIRGSKVAARRYRSAEKMILLDFVADKKLSLPREDNSSIPLWAQLRAAANEAGVGSYFPDYLGDNVDDDHTPFLNAGVQSIDLIDFKFPCWHKVCDNLSAVSEPSLDASGEAVAALLRTLR